MGSRPNNRNKDAPDKSHYDEMQEDTRICGIRAEQTTNTINKNKRASPLFKSRGGAYRVANGHQASELRLDVP